MNYLQKKNRERAKMIKAKSYMESLKGKTRNEALEEYRNKEKSLVAKERISNDVFFGISGLYYLFRGIELLYIGESQCVLTRIAQHRIEDIKDFDSFKIIPFDGTTAERKKFEENLIKTHCPILNGTHNSGVHFYGTPT